MDKKFLNAVLFGALLASSTGTFTSCKDYDDDINGLSERVDAVEKTLADLNTKFGALAYVKSVSFANGVLTVTDQSGTPTTYTIPDNDTNTTYTLDVTSSREGNVTTVTVTLTGSDNSKIVKTFTITDNDTVTQDTKLDPTKFWMDSEGVMWYGTKDDKENSIKTGVAVPKQPQHDKTTVSVVQYKDETGVVVGWEILVDNQPLSTKLLIQDVLPITSFEYIPTKILAGWGERVIVFEENSYKQKTIVANEVKTSATATLYMSNVAAPQYRVNPSSATLAQLTEEGKAQILKQTVEQVTRTPGVFIDWKKTTIENGIMTVSLEADPALFEDEVDKLDMIALQFETTAKNKVTTEYVGVINKDAEIDVVLTDKAVTATNPGDDANHFAITKADAEAQVAKIDDKNMPMTGNAALVQNVTYSEAIAGINLTELVSACNVKDAAGHKFFDYTKYPDLTLSFEAVAYKVNETPQERYMSLDGVTFKAVNYGNVNESCIGKAPMVLAKLTDSHNGNAIVAAAYIKLLIVGDAAAKPEPDITITENATIGIDCNNSAYTWSTNDEFMSTQVYTFSTNEKLTALSKEQFHTLYGYAAAPVVGFDNVGTWNVTEILTAGDNKANRGAKFELTTAPLEAKTYVAYAVYEKTTDADVIVSIANGGMYPKYVAIKHVVKVDPINFTATAKEKAPNAWNGNTASIYCQTPGTTNTTQIIGDLNELFVGGKVQFDYSSSFDAEKFPSFVADNMEYTFVFSEKNLKATRGLVTGVDGTQYQLALNADKTELHAVGKDLTGTAVASAITADNLVASLSDANNNDVTFANTAVAKNLLNKEARGADSFYAVMDIVYENGCDMTVPVTNGEFNLAFIRPVNVSSDASKFFTDGLNEGDPANTLKLGELVTFTDWRKDSPLNSFAANLDYYRYYGVTKIECKGNIADVVETDWTGTRKTLKEAFGAELASQIITITSKNVTYTTAEVTAVPDFGTASYIKSSRVEIKDYKLYIPLTITYTWGTIEETIEVQVKATK